MSYGLGLFVVALVFYVAYLVISTRCTAREEKALQDAENATVEPAEIIGHGDRLYTGRIALTVWVLISLVRGATDIATSYGISDTIIGLMIIAIGTSFELATAIMADPGQRYFGG